MVKYTAIGIMSGTSLDGVDLAGCEFSQQNGKWAFKILAAETIPYNEEWLFRMQKAHLLSGLELSRLNVEYGRFLGRLAYDFIFKHHLNPAIIASHGHTIFHQPSAGLTLQIGSGAEIAAQTRTTVVCDFRSLDVALGGQGAPLVPIGAPCPPNATSRLRKSVVLPIFPLKKMAGGLPSTFVRPTSF